MRSQRPELEEVTMDAREEYGEYSLASPGYRGTMAGYPSQYPGQLLSDVVSRYVCMIVSMSVYVC